MEALHFFFEKVKEGLIKIDLAEIFILFRKYSYLNLDIEKFLETYKKIIDPEFNIINFLSTPSNFTKFERDYRFQIEDYEKYGFFVFVKNYNNNNSYKAWVYNHLKAEQKIAVSRDYQYQQAILP